MVSGWGGGRWISSLDFGYVCGMQRSLNGHLSVQAVGCDLLRSVNQCTFML